MSAICSFEAKTLMYASSGTPAVWSISAITSDDQAQISACFKIMVLPAMRLGAANLAA